LQLYAVKIAFPIPPSSIAMDDPSTLNEPRKVFLLPTRVKIAAVTANQRP